MSNVTRPSEVIRIRAAIHKSRVLRGIDKVTGPDKALANLTHCMSEAGFDLDMVRGDSILGDRGSRNLTFSRDGVQITNRTIRYSWEVLSPGLCEVIAYLS